MLEDYKGTLGAQDPKIFYVFCTPEFVVSKLATEIFPLIEPTLFVVDKGHLIQDWGSEFRMDFLHLGMARQYMSCTCAVLSATTTMSSLDEIVDVLNIENMYEIICALPNRPNVYFANHQQSQSSIFIQLLPAT